MDERRHQFNQYREPIRRILMGEWDPIGVADIPEAQDEYDSYVPAVYGRLLGHAPEKELTEFLSQTETVTIGVFGHRQRVDRTVQALLRLRREMEKAC